MTKAYKQPEEVKAEEAMLNQLSFLENQIGVIETINAVPTGKPTNMLNQIKFYSNGSTYRIYIYNAKDNVWRYATLT